MAQFATSQLLATPKALYIKYLENIKGRWPAAESLDKELKRLTPVVGRYHREAHANKNGKHGEFFNIAEILDIHDDVNGRHNAIKTPTSSVAGYRELPLPDSRAIENFLYRLQCCEPTVHTRVIVLHSGRSEPGDRAADTLFFCHVLGVELDLPLTDLRNLAQLYTHHDGHIEDDEQYRQRLLMKPGFVSLGSADNTGKRSVAAYIGRRKIGAFAPHVGEISVQSPHTKSILAVDSCVGNLWEPPIFFVSLDRSSLSARDPGRTWPSTSSPVLFKHAVRRSLVSSSCLKPDDVSSSWLSALIYMDAIVRADSLEDLVSRWQELREKLNAEELKLDTKELEKLSQSAGELCTSLQTSVNQVVAFRKSYPAARYSDFGEAYHYLNRLLADAKPIPLEIQEMINKRQEDLNFKISRTALEESRSAIALTVLAFIFIPLITAPLIFGMNVKEINESTSIWVFAVTACALSSCPGSGWYLRRAPRKQWGNSLRWTFRMPTRRKNIDPNLLLC